MSQKGGGRAVAISSMKLRDLGNSYGFSVSKDALEKLDLLDEDGDLVDENIHVRSTVHEDGRVCYEIPVDDY